jgi:thioredoxin reductase
MASSQEAGEEYSWYLEESYKERPPRQYEHPIVIVGAGMGGVSMALELERRGRGNYQLFERDCRWGGATWNDVANSTTKLQTEKGTYHARFLDFSFGADATLKTWPPRDTVKAMIQKAAEEAGADQKTRLETSVTAVKKVGDPLENGHYVISIANPNGESEDIKASALVTCPGVFYLPKEIPMPGREKFGGYICNGSYDELNKSKLKDIEVAVIGHGGFTIENVRTCLEMGSTKVKIICLTRHFTGQRMTSWLVSGQVQPIPGTTLLKAFEVVYSKIGVDVWSHPEVETDAEHSYVMIKSSTSFGVSDVYFLACMYGLVEMFDKDEVKSLSHHCIHTKQGHDVPCQAIMKCLGSEPDPDVDEIFGIDEIKGYWINGEPLRSIIVIAKGVAARNYGGFSVGPFFASACTTVRYAIDYPEDIMATMPNLPVHKAEKGHPAYYMTTHYTLMCGFLISQIEGLSWQLQFVDKLKAIKTQEAHRMEEILEECATEWTMYINMFKELGSIPKDAEEIPYPYTKEIMDGLIKESVDNWEEENKKAQAKWERMQQKAGKK